MDRCSSAKVRIAFDVSDVKQFVERNENKQNINNYSDMRLISLARIRKNDNEGTIFMKGRSSN